MFTVSVRDRRDVFLSFSLVIYFEADDHGLSCEMFSSAPARSLCAYQRSGAEGREPFPVPFLDVVLAESDSNCSTWNQNMWNPSHGEV
jgi:hypothetical protein